MAEENEERCEACNRIKEPYNPYSEIIECILDGVMTSMCKQCAQTHNAVVVAKPTKGQINSINRPLVHKRKEQMKIQSEMQEFGEIIRKAREKADLTQKELASAIAEEERVISDIEKGNSAVRNENIVIKLKQFLRNNLQQAERKKQEEKQQIKQQKGEIDFSSKEVTIGDLKGIQRKQNSVQKRKQMLKEIEEKIEREEREEKQKEKNEEQE